MDLLELLAKRVGRPLPFSLPTRLPGRPLDTVTALSAREHLNPATALLAASSRRLSDTERAVAVARVKPSSYVADSLYREGATARLRPVQLEALGALAEARGLLGAIGVGHGKTLVAILGAAVVGAKRPVVMVPPNLRETFYAELEKWSETFYLPKVELVPYSVLSRPESSDLLRRLAPDYIFADEAHALRHPTSARTRRLLRYLEENPSTVFAAASGTLTAKSIRDYAHLSKHALGLRSPLPLLNSHLDSWANVIDVDGKPGPVDWKTIEPLVESFGDATTYSASRGKRKREIVRKAYRERLRSAPGVVVTSDESASCSLLIRRLTSPVPPEELYAAFSAIEEGSSPDFETVYEDDAATYRARRQVSAGFFYRWAWERTERGERDDEWLEARARWSRHVRRELETSAIEGYDSPSLVYAKIEEELDKGRRSFIHTALEAWREVADRPTPPVEAVWLSNYLVKAVVEYVSRLEEPALIWYESRALGEKLAEVTSLPLCDSGKPPNGDAKTCLVSIRAHNRGLNLQAWRRNCVVESPSSGQVFEQLIGRTHRAGQLADEVTVDVFVGPKHFSRAFDTAKEQAAYQAATTGQRLKLVYAPVFNVDFKG